MQLLPGIQRDHLGDRHAPRFRPLRRAALHVDRNDSALLPSLIFAVLAIFLARPLGISLVLLRAHISQRARLFIGYVRGLEAELGYFSLAELQQIRGRSRATSW
jgi:NhaP-type Na+/H+ or K+/H+ antiporter